MIAATIGLVGFGVFLVAICATVRYLRVYVRWERESGRLQRMREQLQLAEAHSRPSASTQRPAEAPTVLRPIRRSAA